MHIWLLSRFLSGYYSISASIVTATPDILVHDFQRNRKLEFSEEIALLVKEKQFIFQSMYTN